MSSISTHLALLEHFSPRDVSHLECHFCNVWKHMCLIVLHLAGSPIEEQHNVARQLATLCMTLGEYPAIRFHRNHKVGLVSFMPLQESLKLYCVHRSRVVSQTYSKTNWTRSGA